MGPFFLVLFMAPEVFRLYDFVICCKFSTWDHLPVHPGLRRMHCFELAESFFSSDRIVFISSVQYLSNLFCSELINALRLSMFFLVKFTIVSIKATCLCQKLTMRIHTRTRPFLQSSIFIPYL